MLSCQRDIRRDIPPRWCLPNWMRGDGGTHVGGAVGNRLKGPDQGFWNDLHDLMFEHLSDPQLSAL
jgi:hypothetical protein